MMGGQRGEGKKGEASGIWYKTDVIQQHKTVSLSVIFNHPVTFTFFFSKFSFVNQQDKWCREF